MHKKTLLFDLDGTLSDPKTGITKSFQYALQSFGIDIKDPDTLIPLIGPPLRDSFKKLYGFNDTDTEKAVVKFREYFAFVSGSEMDGTRSDKAEVIHYALGKCGMGDSGEAVMIGDRKHDILGAKAWGLDSVGVLYGYGSRAELCDAGADHIVYSVDELKALLATL